MCRLSWFHASKTETWMRGRHLKTVFLRTSAPKNKGAGLSSVVANKIKLSYEHALKDITFNMWTSTLEGLGTKTEPTLGLQPL